MVRKLASALAVLALLLGGFTSAPVAGTSMAMAGMDLQAPCCADCDQQSLPDEPGCRVLATCMAAPSATSPAANAVSVFYFTRLSQPIFDQFAAPAADVSPPFRPPRTSILA